MNGAGRTPSWTGAWFVLDCGAVVVDASSPRLGVLDDFLVPASVALLRECQTLDWAGLADLSFDSVDGRTLRLTAQPDPRGWRLTCIDDTQRHRLGGADREAEHVGVLTDFAGAVARELVDPMTVVQAKVELVLDLGIEDPAEVRRHLEIALQHSDRVARVLGNLRRISQPHPQSSEPWAITVLFEDVVQQLGAPSRPRLHLQVESGLLATGPLAIAARVVTSLVRGELLRGAEVWLAARMQQGRPTLSIGPSATRRGGTVPLRPSLSGHQPLVSYLGGSLEAYGHGADEWIQLTLPCPPPRRRRRSPRDDDDPVVTLLVLGRPDFVDDVDRRLAPHGFDSRGCRRRSEVLAALVEGGVDAVLLELDLEGPGPRGHALAIDLAERFPAVSFFVAIRAETPPPSLERVVFLRWPADVAEVARLAL